MQEYKAYFVAKYLKPLLLAIEMDVKDAVYLEKDGNEYVHIEFLGGGEANADVTWDSLFSITKECLKAISEA